MKLAIAAGILALGVADTALAQAPAPAFPSGQRALVTQDTQVTVAVDGGVIRRQTADSVCSLRAGNAVQLVSIEAGPTPNVVVRRVLNLSGERLTDAAKRAPGAVVSPGKAVERFRTTCVRNGIVKVPAPIFAKWVEAHKAAAAARGKKEPAKADKKG